MDSSKESQLSAEKDNRREFIKAACGFSLGAALFCAGALTRVFEFFFGPRLSKNEQAGILALKLKRMKDTVHLEGLELERDVNDYIHVAALSDLSSSTGKYFIDYKMEPGLAFVDEKGCPNLLSAKCTHLGCTVGNQVDDKGQVLCPCHMSFFDIKTGKPNQGAPAKTPLPHLSWVLMDKNKHVIAKSNSAGQAPEDIKPVDLKEAHVYIAKAAPENRA